MKRIKWGARVILEIVLNQEGRCPLCGEKLGSIDDMETDHKIPLALGGTDTKDNLQVVHIACHKVKTNGTKATSYGSDKFEIAKRNRLEKKRLEREKRNAEAYALLKPVRNADPEPPQTRSGRKLQSRPFPKRNRAMRGEERRT